MQAKYIEAILKAQGIRFRKCDPETPEGWDPGDEDAPWAPGESFHGFAVDGYEVSIDHTREGVWEVRQSDPMWGPVMVKEITTYEELISFIR